jgi:hypothetical protein
MACQLTNSDANWTATIGSVVTVKLISDYAFILTAKYNEQDLAVRDNSVSFNVVLGPAQLSLAVAGPTDVGEGRPSKGRPTNKRLLEPVTFVEDCGNGQTQALFQANEILPVLAFTIVGV